MLKVIEENGRIKEAQAENLIQHYLFPSRTDLYIKTEDKEKWHTLIVTEGLVGKGNMRLLTTDPHVFYNSFKQQGLNIASIPQLIAWTFSKKTAYARKLRRNLERVHSKYKRESV
jgi:hypothetical protein